MYDKCIELMVEFGVNQGCDASILLNAPDGNDEKSHPANVGIRQEALLAIEELRRVIYKRCLPVVSCSDILVVAAREAVRQVISFISFAVSYCIFILLCFFFCFVHFCCFLIGYRWEAQISMCHWEGKTASRSI